MREDSPLWDAIALWEQITGVAVPTSEFGSGSLGHWRIVDTYKELRETLELDPSEVTTNLIFNILVKDWLSDRKFNMLQLLNDPEKYAAMLVKPAELLKIVTRPEVIEARDEFIGHLERGVTAYGADDRDDIKDLLTKHDTIAILRRDALKALARLRVHQFTVGEPEAEGFRPIYSKTVNQWWNINSLLKAAMSMPSGISMNLIRDPDAFQSFFCFAIRNGANLFILTDAPEYAHPLQGTMTRRPDRQLGTRACQTWFPYDLLGLAWDEDTEQYYVKETEVRALVAYQNEHLPLKPISRLDPHEFLWSTMMLDLIMDKFWKQNFQAPALSYTGEMLVIENVLENHAKSAGLPVAGYQPLALPALSLDTFRSGNLDEKAVGKMGDQPNLWMEERYRDQITDEVLNLVESTGVTLRLNDKTGEVVPDSPELKTALKRTHFDSQRKELLKGTTKLEVLNSTKFGTREELDADRQFIARHNFASAVTKMANDEYDAREKEIMAWYRKAVDANRENLMAYAGMESIWVEVPHELMHGKVGAQYHRGNRNSPDYRTFHQFASRHTYAEGTNAGGAGFGYSFLGAWPRVGGPRCWITDAKASYFQTFAPASAEEIAVLAGCQVSDLPDVIQHWTKRQEDRGNHILDRIDPMNWHAHNPWLRMNFGLVIALSKIGAKKCAALARNPQGLDVITEQEAKGTWYKPSAEDMLS